MKSALAALLALILALGCGGVSVTKITDATYTEGVRYWDSQPYLTAGGKVIWLPDPTRGYVIKPKWGLFAGTTLNVLGTGNRLPNFNFEISGLKPFNPSANIIDANPADILLDFHTNNQYGCAWPESLVGDLTQYSSYCLANGILLGPQFTTQMTGADIIKYLMELSNSEVVWSGGKLQVVPYGDTQATGFPLEYLTYSQYIPTGSPPTITISPWAADYGVLMWIWDANSAEWLPGGDMANVPDNPAQGQYSVNNGVYTFNPADSSTYITINYGVPNPASPPVTFTPDLTPKFNLGIDDFIADKNQDPVTASRTAISDAKNWMRLEIFDRSANYDTALLDVKDQNAIDLYGPRIEDNKEAMPSPTRWWSSSSARPCSRNPCTSAIPINSSWTAAISSWTRWTG